MSAREEASWAWMEEHYPRGVVMLFRRLVLELKEFLRDDSVLLVGSFSTGKALYFQKGDDVSYVSDIDLLVITSKPIGSVLAKGKTIWCRIEGIARSVRAGGSGFHIGIRYRTVVEVPCFAKKVTSLGYEFWDRALWLIDCFDIPRSDVAQDFHVGHCAENLCRKLWCMIRYW